MINKTKFSCLPAGKGGRIKLYIVFVILVLSVLNIYLYLLRKSIYEFIVEEVGLDGSRIEQIRQYREYETNNPQPKFPPIAP